MTITLFNFVLVGTALAIHYRNIAAIYLVAFVNAILGGCSMIAMEFMIEVGFPINESFVLNLYTMISAVF